MSNAPRFASALSVASESKIAFDECVSVVRAGLAGMRPDFLSVFVSHDHGAMIEDLGPRLAQALEARVLIGCTGEMIVGREREIESGPALSVWAAALPGTTVRPFRVEFAQAEDGAPTFSALPEVIEGKRASLIVLADPFSFPAADYLEILNERLPGVPAIGGMASGGTGPGQNLLLTETGVVDSGAIGVVLEGDVEVCPIVSQGCRPVGKPFVITSCHENLLQKLGGKQALEALVELLRSLPLEDQKLLQLGPFVGLAVDPTKSTFERGDFLVRGIVGLDKDTQAIAVADHALRVGQTMQFLVRDGASAGEDLTQLVKERARGYPSSAGALVFSCNGRGTRMFQQQDHDITCIRTGFGADLPAAGFFAMGEIGPIGGRNFLHGLTASVALFRARG